MIFDVLYTFFSIVQRFVAKATDRMEEVRDFELVSFLQFCHLFIRAFVLAL